MKSADVICVCGGCYGVHENFCGPLDTLSFFLFTSLLLRLAKGGLPGRYEVFWDTKV